MMTKKKIVAVILTALLAVSIFAGCSNKEQAKPEYMPTPSTVSGTGDTTEYQMKNVSFKIANEDFDSYIKDENQVAFRKTDSIGMVKDGLTFAIFSTEHKDIGNKDIQNKLLDELTPENGTANGFQLISSGEETVGEIKGFKVDMKANPDGKNAFMNVFLFNYDDGIMSISYASKDKSTEQIDTELNKIINTIEFKNT